MRNIFQKDYENSFSGSDAVCIKRPEKIIKVPPESRLSLEKLQKGLEDKNIESMVFNFTDEIVDWLDKILKPGDVVLVMSNKGFDQIHDKILNRLSQRKN
jgi:UDP-N-acetylmuramate: L-alanyl-gamma-D-glutamyl-meso-diaminopimelate ligase